MLLRWLTCYCLALACFAFGGDGSASWQFAGISVLNSAPRDCRRERFRSVILS